MTDVLTDDAERVQAAPDRSPGTRRERAAAYVRRLIAWLRRYQVRLWVTALILLLLLLYFWKDIFIPIGPGEEGVLWSRFGGGTVTAHTYGEGYHAILPWDKMTVYNVRLQEMHDTVQVLTIDGLQVSLAITVRYSLRAADLPTLQQKVGPRYAATVVWPDAVTAVRHVVRQLKPEQLGFLSETNLSGQIDAAARQAVGKHWVDLDRILITQITLPGPVEAQIQDKLAQEQKVLSYQFLQDQTELERQRRLVEAQGIRDFEQRSHVSFLKWRGIEATEHLANSPNTKIVVMGASGSQLPVLFSAEK